MAILVIKSGTTAIAGSTVKGSFSYFSANTTTDLGPTDVTGFYSGVDAPNNGYTVYQIGGSDGWTARVATDDATLNSILISAGATGSTLDERITWATNTDSVYINSGTTAPGSPGNYLVDAFQLTGGVCALTPIISNYAISTPSSVVVGKWYTDPAGPGGGVAVHILSINGIVGFIVASLINERDTCDL